MNIKQQINCKKVGESLSATATAFMKFRISDGAYNFPRKNSRGNRLLQELTFAIWFVDYLIEEVSKPGLLLLKDIRHAAFDKFKEIHVICENVQEVIISKEMTVLLIYGWVTTRFEHTTLGVKLSSKEWHMLSEQDSAYEKKFGKNWIITEKFIQDKKAKQLLEYRKGIVIAKEVVELLS